LGGRGSRPVSVLSAMHSRDFCRTGTRSIAWLALLLSMLPTLLFAQDTVTLYIEQVTLVSPDAETDPVINLVIRDRELDIVTKDDVPVEEFTLTFNARGKYLLGQLSLGEPPSFVILDKDPRIDFDVLLDSKRHLLLAIKEGEVVENRLAAVAEMPQTQPQERKEPRWLAYTPPPLAMPSAYLDATKWNRWDTKAISGLFSAGLVLDRTRWVSQNDVSELQVGDLDDFSGGEIRGLRFGVVGTLNFADPWVYTIFGATNAFDSGFDQERDDDFAWFDVRVDIPLYKGTTLSIGKQKEPISLERLTPLIYLPMQERSAFIDAMLPARNTGIVLSGSALNRRMTWAGGVFNNFIEGDESIGDTATQLVGRVTGIPWQSPDKSNLFHLGAGYRYSNAKQGTLYLSEPETNNSALFVNTQNIVDAEDMYTVDLEVAWRSGPFVLSGEYMQSEVKSVSAGDPTFSGWYVSGIWALTGEMRQYNPQGGVFQRPPVAKSVYQNGMGAWELTARYSWTDLSDANVNGGEMDIWSAGIRWWLTPFINVDMNYRYISLDGPGLSNDPNLSNGNSGVLNGRLVLLLE
jgi:phosphate-selective porin OprO/OprP